MVGTDDQQRRHPVATDVEGDSIDQLGRLLSETTSIAQWLGTIPWEKWVGTLVGPAVFLVQPALRRFLPRWGTGATVLIAQAQQGATWPQYAFLNVNRTFTPLILGILSAMAGMALPATALLSYGLTADEYDKIRPSILEQGWGAAEEHRPSLDLH